MADKNILVIGSSNTDMVVKTDRFPKPGETILGGEFFMFGGGKGGNQAVAAARLGGNVTFLCKVGTDVFGDNAIQGYKKESVETNYILRDQEQASGVALITVDSEGENSIIVAPGANNNLSIADITESINLIHQADIVLLQLEIPLKTVSHVLKLAKESHKKVILNPAPAAVLSDEDYKNLFLITPNETEAELLSGISVTDEGSAAKAAIHLKEKGVKNVVITMGKNGAYVDAKDFVGLIASPIAKAVDSTAAGDVFNGALAVALAQERSWKETVEFACKAASISVTRMGAQLSAPYLYELI
ncbi:MAG: ribokinase [Flavobacterium sp.]|nr:ribokinase [Pedobacter sp.]